jgi:hypothetical protein
MFVMELIKRTLCMPYIKQPWALGEMDRLIEKQVHHKEGSN